MKITPGFDETITFQQVKTQQKTAKTQEKRSPCIEVRRHEVKKNYSCSDFSIDYEQATHFFSRQEKRSIVDAIFIQHSCTNKRQIQATCTQRDLLQGNVIISEMSNRGDTNDKFVHKPSGCQAFLLLQTGADDLITEKGWK